MKKMIFLVALTLSPAAMADGTASHNIYTPPWEQSSSGQSFTNGKYTPPWKRTDTTAGAMTTGAATTGAVASTGSVATAPQAATGVPQFRREPSDEGQPGERQQGERQAQRLDEFKARIEQRMTQHIAEMQQRLACVQAAATPEALRGCMPPPGERGGHEGPGDLAGGPPTRGGNNGQQLAATAPTGQGMPATSK